MASFDFSKLAHELEVIGDTCGESGVSFEDQQKWWNTAEDAKEVVSALENMKEVNFLKLSGNSLGSNAAVVIGIALERHPELRKALWDNMFTGRCNIEVPLALIHLGHGLKMAKAQLTVLDLSDNALGADGMIGLERLLRSEVCYSLVELRLNNCGLGICGSQMLSESLLNCHKFSTTAGTPLQLKIMEAGGNHFENDGAKELAKIFSTLKTLEVIAMPQNAIYEAGIATLADSFKLNPNLRVLNLNDNILKTDGVFSIAAVFEFTPNLQIIDLSDCLIDTIGAYYLAEDLEHKNHQLEIVDFSYNEIETISGMKLVRAMQNKPNLKRLNLYRNKIDSHGREAIKAIMQLSCNPDALVDLNTDSSSSEDEEKDLTLVTRPDQDKTIEQCSIL